MKVQYTIKKNGEHKQCTKYFSDRKHLENWKRLMNSKHIKVEGIHVLNGWLYR